jgi:hypothetical protein
VIEKQPVLQEQMQHGERCHPQCYLMQQEVPVQQVMDGGRFEYEGPRRYQTPHFHPSQEIRGERTQLQEASTRL